jgi:DHA1 family bicyclomycin/chloramphenicol resistance-like MFS transporter
MIVSSMLFSESPYAIIVPMSLITFGNGFLFPVGSAAALTAIPTVYAGTASGLMGAYQFVIAAVCINWVGEFSHGESIYLSIFIGAIILTGLCSYLFLVVYKPKTRLTVSEGS